MSWLERHVSTALFITPPQCTADEALKHFKNVNIQHCVKQYTVDISSTQISLKQFDDMTISIMSLMILTDVKTVIKLTHSLFKRVHHYLINLKTIVLS